MKPFLILVLSLFALGQGCPGFSGGSDDQVGSDQTPDPTAPDDDTTSPDDDTTTPDDGTTPDDSTPGEDPPPDNGAGPVATFTIKKLNLKATFDATGVSSSGYSADDLVVRWDYTNDGTFDTDWVTKKTTSYTYPADGNYTVAMEVKDPAERLDGATKYFTIASVNTPPKATFAVNLVQGMIGSFDASSSSDEQDASEDLQVRWDFDGDNLYDTDWSTIKTVEHTYSVAAEYTIKLQVKDLNDSTKTATQTIVASPITIRNSFITYGRPYMIRLNFRVINNVTGQPVTPADLPALTREHFAIYEDDALIDLSETNQILYSGNRPMFLVLILDFTGSMYDAGAVEPMIAAAKDFINSQGDSTYISLWAFWERQGGNAEIDDYTPCTSAGKLKLAADLDAFAATYHDRGATEIWDLLAKVVDTKFSEFDNGVNRGIVFLSDGHDTTSATPLNTLITNARNKAVFMFSVGMAFRPDQYPTDEVNLKKIADETGGLYFTVNQVMDLVTVFSQLSEDLVADWTLSYVTLESTGSHQVKTVCNYLNGYSTMIGKYPITENVKGDIKQALLTVFESLDSPEGQTEYTLYSYYIPRNISKFRVKVTSADPAWLTLYDTDTICSPTLGWTISPDVLAGAAPPADGWYTLSAPMSLEYGSWGRIARLTVDAVNSPAVHFELPDFVEQAVLFGDKTMIFRPTEAISMDVP